MMRYYLTCYLVVTAEDADDADAKIAAVMGDSTERELGDGVVLGGVEGDWDAEIEDDPCTCPPDLVARGGFRSGCPVHA